MITRWRVIAKSKCVCLWAAYYVCEHIRRTLYDVHDQKCTLNVSKHVRRHCTSVRIYVGEWVRWTFYVCKHVRRKMYVCEHVWMSVKHTYVILYVRENVRRKKNIYMCTCIYLWACPCTSMVCSTEIVSLWACTSVSIVRPWASRHIDMYVCLWACRLREVRVNIRVHTALCVVYDVQYTMYVAHCT